MVTTGDAIGIFYAVLFGVPLLILVIYLLMRVQVVEQGTSMIVERYGRFHRRCDAGIHVLVPFIDRPRPITWRLTETYVDRHGNQSVRVHQTRITRIDLRENVMDFSNQPVITRDNVELLVHPMLLYRLKDPVRVAYETYDLSQATTKLVQTTLRSIIGDMGLDDTLASREEIERLLMNKIKNVCSNWGLLITGVDLLEITPTPTVQAAMHQQLAAERVRRAAIVTADGYREQVKTKAEGECQSQISLATGHARVAELRARGVAEGRVLVARAEAEAVRLIADAVKEFGVDPTQYLISLRYIDTLTALACNAAKRVVYFPYESDVVGTLGQHP